VKVRNGRTGTLGVPLVRFPGVHSRRLWKWSTSHPHFQVWRPRAREADQLSFQDFVGVSRVTLCRQDSPWTATQHCLVESEVWCIASGKKRLDWHPLAQKGAAAETARIKVIESDDAVEL